MVSEDLFRPPASLPGWGLTIYGREVCEPPHVTIKSPGGQRIYRWDLRRRRLMDLRADPRLFPAEMEALLNERHAALRQRWNGMDPRNPVDEEKDDA